MAELIKENLPEYNKLKGAIFLRLPQISKNYAPHDKNETEPVWLSPVFAIFQAPPCKVIRIGKRVQPVTSNAQQR